MIGEIDSFVFIIRLNGIKWERERERRRDWRILFYRDVQREFFF